MTDLKRWIKGIETLDPPSTWEPPAAPLAFPPPSRGRRIVTILTAAAIAVAGVTFAVVTLKPRRVSVVTSEPAASSEAPAWLRDKAGQMATTNGDAEPDLALWGLVTVAEADPLVGLKPTADDAHRWEYVVVLEGHFLCTSCKSLVPIRGSVIVFTADPDSRSILDFSVVSEVSVANLHLQSLDQGESATYDSPETPWTYPMPSGWTTSRFRTNPDPNAKTGVLITHLTDAPYTFDASSPGPNSGAGATELLGSHAVVVQAALLWYPPNEEPRWHPSASPTNIGASSAWHDDAQNPGWSFRERRVCRGTACVSVVEWHGPDASPEAIGVAQSVAESIDLKTTWPTPASSSTQSRTTAPIAPASVGAQVTASIRVGPFPNAIAVGEGGVWVASTNNDGTGAGDIVRIDPQTGEIVDRIPVDSLAGWEFGGGGIFAGEGSVWVFGAKRVDDKETAIVQQIDPATDRVVDVIQLGSGTPAGDVWVDGTGIWAMYLTQEPNTIEVAHADLETHALISTFTVPGEWSQTIFGAGGSIWVAALVTGTDGAFGGPGGQAYLDRIDPATGSVQIAARSDGSWTFAAPGGTQWVRVSGGVQRFDYATGSLVGDPIQLSSAGCCSGAFVSDGGGGAWVANLRGPAETRGMWHIDVSGGVDEFVDLSSVDDLTPWGGIAYAFDPGTNSLWVTQYEHTVTRIQIG